MDFRKQVSRCTVPVILELIGLINQHPPLFDAIARIFLQYYAYNPDEYADVCWLIETRVEGLYDLAPAQKKRVIQLLQYMYQQKNLQRLRSLFLEEAIAQWGPFSNQLTSPVIYMEPQLYDGKQLIGQGESRFDVVFFESEQQPLELIECKSNIETFLLHDVQFDQLSKATRNKLTYMNNVRHYLLLYYVEPVIYFACYNDNCDRVRENLHQTWGYGYVQFLYPEVIIKKLAHP